MNEPVLLSEDVGAVRRLTLNRPASLNALNDELLEALDEAFAAAAADGSVRVLILRGAGRAFCAGYDLNQDAEEGPRTRRPGGRSCAVTPTASSGSCTTRSR